MGLCIKSFFGGEVSFDGCSQEFIDANFRFKPENGPGLVKGNLDGFDIDGIYLNPTDPANPPDPSIIKVPDHCRAEITCSEDGYTIRYCCNIAANIYVHLFKPEKKLQAFGHGDTPDGWPENNESNWNAAN